MHERQETSQLSPLTSLSQCLIPWSCWNPVTHHHCLWLSLFLLFLCHNPSSSVSSLEIITFIHYPQVPTRLPRGIRLGSSIGLFPFQSKNSITGFINSLMRPGGAAEKNMVFETMSSSCSSTVVSNMILSKFLTSLSLSFILCTIGIKENICWMELTS